MPRQVKAKHEGKKGGESSTLIFLGLAAQRTRPVNTCESVLTVSDGGNKEGWRKRRNPKQSRRGGKKVSWYAKIP